MNEPTAQRRLQDQPRPARPPLYQQIFSILENKIMNKEFHEGEFLPGEREIQQMFNVSRITAVRALNELALRGLAIRERGRGTRVQFVERGTVSRGPSNVRGPKSNDMVASVDEFLARHGPKKAGRIKVFSFEYIRVPESIVGAMGLPKDDLVQKSEKIWRLGGSPLAHITTYVPAELGKKWTREDMAATPSTSLLAREGVKIARIEERITAIAASRLFATRLEIKAGIPLIEISRTSFDPHGRVVEYAIGAYVPDRFQYAVSVTREGANVSGPRLAVKNPN